MFSSSNILSAPAVFQTYLLPSIPFRRRQSSGSNSSFVSYSARHSSFGSPASAATPPTPASPHEAQFFDSSSSSSNPNASGTAYHFQATASPGSLWSRHDSHDSAVSGPYAFSPLRPSYLSGHTSHISCAKCHADFALTSQIISKGFTGRHGRAYLVAPGTSSLTCTPCTSPGGNGCMYLQSSAFSYVSALCPPHFSCLFLRIHCQSQRSNLILSSTVFTKYPYASAGSPAPGHWSAHRC